MQLNEMQIRLRAYAIWEEEGCPVGREWLHWERALKELAGNENSPPAAQVLAKGRKSAEKKPSRKRAA